MGSLLQNTVFGRVKNVFVSSWRTSSTSSGSSTQTQIKLPLVSSGSYNFNIDWGDGTSNKITVWNQAQTTHNYSVAGDYILKITGTCTGWVFNNTGDRLKIRSIESWGKLRLGNSGSYFYGCTNLDLSRVSDVLDLTGTTILASGFRACGTLASINRLTEWNTSLVTNMDFMFQNATAFNQNIGALNVSGVSDFTAMFQGCGSFNNGSNSDINNWIIKSTGTVTMGQMFASAGSFNQPINLWNTIAVINMSGMFQLASLFNQNIGAWNVSNVTTFASMFASAIAFNNGGSNSINSWITSSATAMNSMFSSATVFNQPIGNWNTSNVANFASMFSMANTFNQNIGTWNVSKSLSFSSMFNNAINFSNAGSPDINNWILSTTGNIDTSFMFRSSKLNQPLSNWITTRITNMNQMFNSNSVFNQDVGGWDVSSVTDFTAMFSNATAFNNGGSNTINNWVIKTIGTVNMTSMFSNALLFNQPIGNWNMSAVTSTAAMFATAKVFNKDISSWNVSKVTTMAQMFYQAHLFNQNIGSWNVSNVTLMGQMFQSATAFNQNIGNWNISNVTDFTNLMAGKTPAIFSATNLDAIYNGWSTVVGGIKSGRVISFGTIKHTAAGSAGKAILMGSPNNWIITDGGI